MDNLANVLPKYSYRKFQLLLNLKFYKRRNKSSLSILIRDVFDAFSFLHEKIKNIWLDVWLAYINVGNTTSYKYGSLEIDERIFLITGTDTCWRIEIRSRTSARPRGAASLTATRGAWGGIRRIITPAAKSTKASVLAVPRLGLTRLTHLEAIPAHQAHLVQPPRQMDTGTRPWSSFSPPNPRKRNSKR